MNTIADNVTRVYTYRLFLITLSMHKCYLIFFKHRYINIGNLHIINELKFSRNLRHFISNKL